MRTTIDLYTFSALRRHAPVLPSVLYRHNDNPEEAVPPPWEDR